MEIKTITEDKSLTTKLRKLSTYISNNKDGIVNYAERKNKGLVFTSNLAESTVNTLINERQKGKQKMLWGREGLIMFCKLERRNVADHGLKTGKM